MQKCNPLYETRTRRICHSPEALIAKKTARRLVVVRSFLVIFNSFSGSHFRLAWCLAVDIIVNVFFPYRRMW